MSLSVQFLLLCLLFSCNNPHVNKASAKSSDSLNDQGKFCHSSIGFDTSSATLYITVDIDTVDHLRSMVDYFSCIKTHVDNDPFLREKMIKNSKYIYFELNSLNITDVNYELINYADTSAFWTGYTDDKTRREYFFEFIVKSGYSRKWEQVLSEILGKKYKWKYGAENIFFIRGIELSAMQSRKYKKEIYPRSFELYMTRE